MTEETGMSPLAANMKIVAERWPEIGRILQGAPRPSEVVFTEQQPSPTLFIDGIHLSSGYDPVREAELQAVLVPADSRSAWVYGIGAGHLPRVLLKRAALAKMVVVIMNHGVAALSLAYFDHADWLADPRLELVLAEDEQEIQVPFAAVPSCLQLASGAASRLRDLVFLELATPFSEKRLRGLKESWRPRLQENISFIQDDGDVASLFGTRPGERIIVAAAGPTLSTHYQWLKSQVGQSVLIAVDAALKPLIAGGVYPDLVVSVDGLPVVAKFFKDVDLIPFQQSTLVYTPILYHEIMEMWPGTRLISYLEDPLYAEISREYPRGSLFSSGSVIHPAVDLAVKMGAGEVVLLGADFSFPGGKTHVEGCFRSSDRSGIANAHWVINGEGERVATSPNFRGFLRDLERYIRDHPRIRFVNGSRRGARIEGTFDLDEEEI